MVTVIGSGAMIGKTGMETNFLLPGGLSAPTPALRGAPPAGARGSRMTGSAPSGAMGGLAVVAAVAGATICRAAAVKKKGVKVVHGKELILGTLG